MRISDWSSDVCSSDLEGQLLRRSDLDGLAGRRIAAFTRRAVLYLEFAEAVQRDFLALRCGVRDGGEDAIDIFARIGLGNAVRGGKGVGYVTIVHEDHSILQNCHPDTNHIVVGGDRKSTRLNSNH